MRTETEKIQKIEDVLRIRLSKMKISKKDLREVKLLHLFASCVESPLLPEINKIWLDIQDLDKCICCKHRS